jgi:UDP-N-acetylglucosamine:LPS N-acetylglucosamine transferase
VAQGIGVWLGVQGFINMGVNMGLLPTKGLTLPLMSFGGSGILANCVALAVLLRIDWENRQLMRGAKGMRDATRHGGRNRRPCFPGLAVADLLKSRDWRVVWMGAPDGMEAKLVPARGYEMAWVRFAALRGKGLLRKLLLPFHLLAACWQARREIRRVRPDVVLGMGGYVSFPGRHDGRAARSPADHSRTELDRRPGQPGARQACQAGCLWFSECLPSGVWVGNPLRPEMKQAAGAGAASGRSRSAGAPAGSRWQPGCRCAQRNRPRGLALIDAEERPLVVHQAGEKHLAQLRQNYEAAGCRRTASLSSKTWRVPTSGLTW